MRKKPVHEFQDHGLAAATSGTPMPPVVTPKAEAPKPPKIGQAWLGQGGIYAGIIRGADGKPDYHLVVPPDAISQPWGGYGKNEPGADSEYDGFANTQALVTSEIFHPAAHWASDLVVDECHDFYLPAIRELSLLYANVPELFERSWHWSSTQYSADSAWVRGFGNGGQVNVRKDGECSVRAVRRLVI